MKHFFLIGAAGYVAPRHFKAIKETGNKLLAIYDKFDSVGIIDSWFPDADFFTEFERFDRHLEKLRRRSISLDYLSICSPNYLHDAHIRFGLRLGMDVICEKPLVLNPWNIDALREIEAESGKKVNSILQLRLHPGAIRLREQIQQEHSKGKHEVNLTYITSRGTWYYGSWKGVLEKSGGIATNIGIHFFDLLLWLFGPVKQQVVHQNAHDRAAGFLELEKANVRWFLSINPETLPAEVQAKGGRTFRSLTINETAFDFTSGFEDLHTISYQHILEGNGFTLEDSAPSIDLAYQIRNATPEPPDEQAHPLAFLPPAKHPFSKG